MSSSSLRVPFKAAALAVKTVFDHPALSHVDPDIKNEIMTNVIARIAGEMSGILPSADNISGEVQDGNVVIAFDEKAKSNLGSIYEDVSRVAESCTPGMRLEDYYTVVNPINPSSVSSSSALFDDARVHTRSKRLREIFEP